jgi:hypothetical protein
MKTKTISTERGKELGIEEFPNFSIHGSIIGMKKHFYGKNDLLVRCGSFIYNVTNGGKHIYEEAH